MTSLRTVRVLVEIETNKSRHTAAYQIDADETIVQFFERVRMLVEAILDMVIG